MILSIYTDGGSRGNPGPSSIGMVFYLSADRQDIEGKKIFTHREDIGIATNNIAEYTAVVRALEQVKSQKLNIKSILKIEFYSDSRLLVNQVKGLFKVKNVHIRGCIFKIRILEQEIGLPISYHLIPREQNTVADQLVNLQKSS